MDSSDRLFRREKSLHEIFGAGLVADVILWREKNVTLSILLGALSAWFIFEKTTYTLLSFVSSVLLLLILILFLWAKSAEILNRPAPPIPQLNLSEETVNYAASLIRARVNSFLSVSHDIALGKYPKLFFKVAGCLFLMSVFGAMIDFFTLAYTSIFIVLTIPALYERYEDHIENYIILEHKKLKQLYVLFDEKCVTKFQRWFLEKRKLC